MRQDVMQGVAEEIVDAVLEAEWRNKRRTDTLSNTEKWNAGRREAIEAVRKILARCE